MLDFSDYADCVTYINQRPDTGGGYSGEWYFADEESLILYHGTFGNDHSPGCSFATWHQEFDDAAEFAAVVARLEAMPEFLDPDEDEDTEEDEDEADEMQMVAE